LIRNDSKTEFFENLVKREREKAIGWLQKKYGRFRLTECEDIFQEATLELWKKLVSMTEWAGESLDGLLYRICRNLATHHLQKLAVVEEWDDAYIDEEIAVETDFGYVSPDVYRKMQKERIYEVIDQLAPSDRNLMYMHLQHVKMKEICSRLGYSSSQVVKNRKRLIVARLRKEIGGQVITCPLFFRKNLLVTCYLLVVFGIFIVITKKIKTYERIQNARKHNH